MPHCNPRTWADAAEARDQARRAAAADHAEDELTAQLRASVPPQGAAPPAEDPEWVRYVRLVVDLEDTP